MDNLFFNEKELMEKQEEEEELMVEAEEEEEEAEESIRSSNKKESIFSLSLLHELINQNTSNNNICICYLSLFFIYCYIYLHSSNKKLREEISSQILQNSKEGEINTIEHDIIKEINNLIFIFTINSSLSYVFTDTAQSIIEISFMLRNFFFPKVNEDYFELLFDNEFNKHKFNDIISMNIGKEKTKSHISFINEKLHSLSLNADNTNDAIKKIEKANLSSFIYLQASFSRKLKTITTKQGITFIRDQIKCRYLKDEKKEVVILDTQRNLELVLIKIEQKENDKNIISTLVNENNNQYTKEEINVIVPCFSINVVNDINKITSKIYGFSLEKDPQFDNIIQVITLELNKYGLNTTKNTEKKNIERKRKETELLTEEEDNKRGKKVKNSSSQSSFVNKTAVFTNNFYLFVCEKSKRVLEKPIISVYIANPNNLGFNNYNYHQNEDKIINTIYSSFYYSPIMTRNIFQISNFDNDFFVKELLNNRYINTIEFNFMKIPNIDLLCLILEYIPFLSTLVLTSNELSKFKFIQLIQALSKNKNISFSLKTLKIINNQIDDEIIQYLSNALMNNTVLTYLSLRNNNITENGMIYLSDCLKNKQQLKNFVIIDNNIGNLGLERLSNVFINLPSLKEIYFNNNNITDISRFQCPSAHTVSFSFNKIELLGVSKITKEKFPLLSTLIINGCISSISGNNNISNLPFLSSILLRDNALNNEKLSSLCIALKDCPLREINLSKNDISNNDLFNQINFFNSQKPFLKQLSLANNNIDNMENLKYFFNNNTTLQILDISNNNIRQYQMLLFLSSLSNCTLSKLDISKNRKDKIYKVLFNFLYINYSIMSLTYDKTYDFPDDIIENFILINNLSRNYLNPSITEYMKIVRGTAISDNKKEVTKKNIKNFMVTIESIAVSEKLFIPKNIMELIVSFINFKKIILDNGIIYNNKVSRYFNLK